jgi:hypothetical protein
MGLDITGLGSVFDFGSTIINKIFPDKDAADKAKIALLELQQQGAFKELELQQQVSLEQIKTNAVEAASSSLFVGGWRPFIGWICGFALGYNYIGMPVLTWFARWYDPSAPPMPVLETSELMTLLLGMLGLGGMRSYEKVNKVASK